MKISSFDLQKKLLNKNKNALIKPYNRYIQERKSMRKILDNINYALSENTNNLGIYKKNNGSTIRLLKEYYNNNTIDGTGKENNYNKNNISAYSTLTEDRNHNFNLYNKYLTINQNYKNQGNNYISGKKYLSPFNKYNIDESRYTKKKNNNNISNDSTIDNTNLNQIYNFTDFNSSNNSNNYLFINPSLNNNNIQPYPTLKTRIDLNSIDSQDLIENNSAIQSNYSYLNLSNEYALNNDLNYNNNTVTNNYDNMPLNYNQSFYQNQMNSNGNTLGELNLDNIINLNNHTNSGLRSDITINENNNIEINNSNLAQNNYEYNSNITSNELTITQNNDNNNTKILNDISNGYINNTINANLKNIINQEQNHYLNQTSTSINDNYINNILNNNYSSFQTIPNNNLMTINIDDYINPTLNNHHIQFNQMNPFKLEEKDLEQNDLISQNDNIYLDSNKSILSKNAESLRLTLAKDKMIPKTEIESQLLNQSSQINFASNSGVEDGVLKKYAASSRPGKDKRGMTKTNQDSFISRVNINNIKDFNIFGVLDGHGPSGHYISKFASLFIQNYIINHPEIKNLSTLESIYLKLKENNFYIIKQSFISVDQQLKSQKFDSKDSGTTCVLVVQIGNHIICANVGDSRAIAVFDENNDKNINQFKAVPLSIDYKPDIPEERNRILMSGGLVEQAVNSLGIRMGPYRIFAPGEDYPGLAMSRSIGDLEGKNFGVIAEPGIIEYNIDDNSKYIVLCSDGVWEFLSNERVKETGKLFYLSNNPNDFVEELLKQSIIEWEGNDSIIDDITAIVLYF